MRKYGSISDIIVERNDELMRVYHEMICAPGKIVLKDLLNVLVNMPCRRFWVSEERAAIVVSTIMKGGDPCIGGNMKREMFEEIYRRAMVMLREHPEMTIPDIAFKVVRQPAPKFYMTPGSAKVTICLHKREWYEKRKRKLRHLL